MSGLQGQLEGLPGFSVAMDAFNTYAEEHFNGKDPYEDENGKRRLPPSSTEEERRLWKTVQLKAWTHDKCFMGSCGVGMDCGLGLAPLVVLLFPGIGPLVMYGVHARLIHIATQRMVLPQKLVAKLELQILMDLLITFPPVIGAFFGWLHGCLTRNAAAIYAYMVYVIDQREKNPKPTYLGTLRDIAQGRAREPAYVGTERAQNYNGQTVGVYERQP